VSVPPPSPATPPKRPGLKIETKWVATWVGGVVVLLVIYAAVSGGRTNTSSPAAVPAASPAPVVSHSSAAKAVAAPKAPSNRDIAARIMAWNSGGGQDRLNALSRDMSAIGADGQNQDASQMSADCTTLSGDVKSAQQYDPIPDGEAQQHWAAGLADVASAASDCTAGTASLDTAQILKASAEISAGNDELVKTAARLRTIADNM